MGKNKKILFIVDMQAEPLRRLPQSIIDNIMVLLDDKAAFGIGSVVATQFFNTEDSLYVSELGWSGCLESEDIAIPSKITEKADLIVSKPTYGIGEAMLRTVFEDIMGSEELPKEVYLVGTDIDACIYAIALELWDIGIVPRIVLPCTGTTNTTPGAFETGLQILGRQIGKHNLIHSLCELQEK